MKYKMTVSVLFAAVALYDGLLGLVFFAWPLAIFVWLGVTPPNHVGYVQFPALLLLIFAAMFARIAADPEHTRDLIPYGIALKVFYSGLVFWYWFTSGIPDMWKPFAVIDAITAIVFFWVFIRIIPER